MNRPGELNPQQFRRTLTRSLAIPLLSGVVIGIVLLAEVIYLVRLQHWVAQTDRLIEQAFTVEKFLLDQETGLRGFLLAGEPEYLAPYESALPKIIPALDALESGVRDDASQLARVRRTRQNHAGWASFAREILARRSATQDISSEIRTARGKRRMDAMRDDLEALIDHEQAARARRVRASTVAAWIVIISTGGLTLLGSLLVALVARRQLVRLAASYRESLAVIQRQHDDLRESQQQYQRLVELSPEAIFVQSGGAVVYANPAFASLLGYADQSQLAGRKVLDLVHPDYHALVRERIGLIDEQHLDVPLLEERFLRADGRQVWVEVAAGPLTFDGKPAAQVIVRDITARRLAEEALRRSETMLAKAQSIAHLGSWELDIANGDVKWSDEMYRIFGQDPATFQTTRDAIQSLLHDDDRDAVIRAADESIAHDVPFDIDHRIVRPSGVVRYVNSQGQVQRDPSGKPLRFIGTMLDITERKLAEDELRLLNETLEQRVQQRTAELRQALDDVGAFSYTISHDLRAPLRNIQAQGRELLERSAAALDETATEQARRIVASAARMDRLTQEILEYSRLSRRELAPQRISTGLVLHEVIGQLQRDPDFAPAQMWVEEPMPWVLAHRATLATVFWNLLANAARFVAPGVTPLVQVRSERRDDRAVIWVQDNGVGIAPQDQARIFDVFERLHPAGPERATDDGPDGGSGLGLAIVRRGVERMGGRVGVESALGQGSRFWIELPLDPQSP
jgi:PAS domain S-box-containing protein